MAIAETQDFVVTRSFAAARAKVWQAWTDPQALGQWWGPKGADMRVVTLDLRPGGLFHYAFAFQPGQEIYGRFVFREVVAPERLVYVSAFSDADGGITRAPFPQLEGKWPLEVHNTVTFGEHKGGTMLTLRARPIEATADEHKVFAGLFDSMRQGFGGTFDQLDAYLKG